MSDKKLCSIIVPCYNEEDAIPIYYNTVSPIIDKISDLEFEFWFIDDGSTDNTLNVVKSLRNDDKRVHFVSFSRNFGKEGGLYAGLQHAKGDYIVTMDVDLQDPPELLEEMYAAVKDGEYDCAATRRVDRKGEPPIRSFFARMFYRLINKISKADIVDGARDYRFMTRKMVDSILSMGEYNRFTKGIFGWVGFRTKWIPFENVERCAGETKWSFWKLFVYSLDGIAAFSTAPLSIASVMGILCCLLSFIGAIFKLVESNDLWSWVFKWAAIGGAATFVGSVIYCLVRDYLDEHKKKKEKKNK